jgi:DNA polymerase-1
MNIAIDVETTKAPNHFPWSKDSALVCLSMAKDDGTLRTWFFNHPCRNKYHPDQTYAESLEEIQNEINASDRIIAHNLKFDYHWMRHMGLDLSSVPLYCTMVVEYNINAHYKQEGISLRELCKKYGIPEKKDKVKIYWDAGADTWEVPAEILRVYCEQDTINALALFSKQVPRILGSNLSKIISLEMETLRCIADMERNGMTVDSEQLSMYNELYTKDLEVIDERLRTCLSIENPDSPDQLSKGLFGYKDTHQPLFDAKKFGVTAASKEGLFSVAVPEILKLKAKTPEQRRILDDLRDRSRLSQLQSTYFRGLQKFVDGGVIHHTINQCITVTGRTSCSRPNLQNQPRGNTGPVKKCFTTRWR